MSYNQWMLPNDAESESQAQNGGRHGLQITGQNGGDGRMDQSPYFDIIFIIIVINYHCHILWASLSLSLALLSLSAIAVAVAG